MRYATFLKNDIFGTRLRSTINKSAADNAIAQGYYNIPKRFEINLPKEEAIKIISEEEYDQLKFLEELTLDETRLSFDSIMDYFKDY